MPEGQKILPVAFFRTEQGAEPVRVWLAELTPEDRRIIGHDIGRVELGWPIGMPVCRPLGEGLWEVRSSLPGGRIARVIFCIADGFMVLLHGFEKKTRKAPQADLEKARKRMKDVKK